VGLLGGEGGGGRQGHEGSEDEQRGCGAWDSHAQMVGGGGVGVNGGWLTGLALRYSHIVTITAMRRRTDDEDGRTGTMGKEILGEFELMVLLAALRLNGGGDGAHALAIADDIGERTGRSVRRSAVYVTLKRLEKKGMTESWLGDSRPERGGKARRLVRVLPEGVAAVHASRSALENMWVGLDTTPEEA